MGKTTGDNTNSTAGTVATFEAIFKEHFKALHIYACSFTKDETEAEEIVQSVFCKLWEKKEQIPAMQSVTAYLYKMVYNEGLNYQKHAMVKAKHKAHALSTPEPGETTDHAALNELRQEIEKAMSDLPEQCRTIFQMSRFEALKYRDIAAKLKISEKTVEGQMTKALRILRTRLSKFLPVLLMVFINVKN
jgi:RNA polymerase sigma-70 factor (ECF subfamily)